MAKQTDDRQHTAEEPPSHEETMEAQMSRTMVNAYMEWLKAGKPHKR